MKPSNERTCSPGLLEALRARARGRPAIGFADFMDVALYDPAEGYYRKGRPRIGYGPGTDFLTATASAPLFGRLVVAACVQILGAAPAAGYDFVELGAERGLGVLGNHPHPFRTARRVGIGETLRIEGPCVVFSNELFDAQPFRRFRYRAGAWRELGVSIGAAGLEEVELGPGEPLDVRLPETAPEGYAIDAPLASAALARAIAGQPWHGLFLAFDYGKSWEEIAFGTPGGTARAYRGHVQGNDLLAHPGDQDLTCHVCWDWLSEALLGSGFGDPRVESQEAFFTRHAADFIQTFTASEAGRLSRDKLSLLQLLHPSHMGQKFQALWAVRPDPARLQA
jgi:SAM-dependent MidA family methyltransferase